MHRLFRHVQFLLTVRAMSKRRLFRAADLEAILLQGGAKNEHPLGQPTLLDPTYIKHQKKLYHPPTHLFI